MAHRDSIDLISSVRLFLAHIAARLPGAGKNGDDLLALSSETQALERQLSKNLAVQFGDGFRTSLKREFAARLSELLYTPIPPDDEHHEDTLSPTAGGWSRPTRLFKRPDEPEARGDPDGVEKLYEYFYWAAKRSESKKIMPVIVDESVQQVMDLSSNTEAASGNAFDRKTSPKMEMENEAERRRAALGAFAETLAPVVRQLENERDLAMTRANEGIRDLYATYIERIAVIRSSRGLPDDLLDLMAVRSREHMRAMEIQALNETGLLASQIDLNQIVSTILMARLAHIDATFGKAYREARDRQRAHYRSWAAVRQALDDYTPKEVKVIELSEDIRRNELRRELIAGSVLCIIDSTGAKLLRRSTVEASGPPPYFMNWLGRERDHLEDIAELEFTNGAGRAAESKP